MEGGKVSRMRLAEREGRGKRGSTTEATDCLLCRSSAEESLLSAERKCESFK